MRSRSITGFLFALAIQSSAALHAEDCGLKQVASLAIRTDRGVPVVQVTVDKTPRWLIVDTGGVSLLSDDVVRELKSQPRAVNAESYYQANGKESDRFVRIHDLEVGVAHVKIWDILAAPPTQHFSNDVAGTLGIEFLKSFDLDFDFGAQKLNLMSPDHCEGKVVYWSKSYDIVPFDTPEGGHIEIAVTLDGKDTRGDLDTGSTESQLMSTAAHARFGIDEDSPGVVRGKTPDDLHTTLHTLTIGGITVQNPRFHLLDNAMDRAYRKDMGVAIFQPGMPKTLLPGIIIGADILRHLHLYVAYGEKKLYVTPASMPATAAEKPANEPH